MKLRTRGSAAAIAATFILSTGLSGVPAQAPVPADQRNPAKGPERQRAVRFGPDPYAKPLPSRGQFGDPLRGLTPAQATDFAQGLEEFEHTEDAEGGLGPIFNNTSCVICHNAGGTGGASAQTVTRFGRVDRGVFNPWTELGGTLLQQFGIDPGCVETVPVQANVVAKRQSTPLFGLGLIEAIPDDDIRRNATARKPDGIRGRAAVVWDVATSQTRVGRFGWKAQVATLLTFAGDAYVNEMGVTSRLFPHENAPNGDQAKLARYDRVADPEDQVDPVSGKGDIDHAADFMRLLAPPPTLKMSKNARLGQQVFQQSNCAVCHLPAMSTGASPVAALDRQAVNLYSDLLLHDMGALGDGIVQDSAGPRDMRTAPLWGLRVSGPYLHDGRAATIDAAIRAHDGEAAASRDRYNRLNPEQRRQLLEFLGTI